MVAIAAGNFEMDLFFFGTNPLLAHSLFFMHLMDGAGMRPAGEDFHRWVPPRWTWIEGSGHERRAGVR